MALDVPARGDGDGGAPERRETSVGRAGEGGTLADRRSGSAARVADGGVGQGQILCGAGHA